jgi:hypothetical protein
MVATDVLEPLSLCRHVWAARQPQQRTATRFKVLHHHSPKRIVRVDHLVVNKHSGCERVGNRLDHVSTFLSLKKGDDVRV